MKSDLNTLLDFVRFTHQIRNVRRAMMFEDNLHENDAEHGYQLALVAWFLIDENKMEFDSYRCVGMALVHDIIEVYAGDTVAFASDDVISAQAQKEKTAVDELKHQWPNFVSLNDLVKEYEKLDTAEAKFIYALDKLLPVINNYLYDGKAWKEHGVSFEKMKSIKIGKIELSSEVNEYYQDLLKVLEHKPELFGAPSKNGVEL